MENMKAKIWVDDVRPMPKESYVWCKFLEQKVAQLDKDGNVIAIFNSAKEAAQSFGRPKDSHIGDCCKGRRKTCFGYRWRYER